MGQNTALHRARTHRAYLKDLYDLYDLYDYNRIPVCIIITFLYVLQDIVAALMPF